MCHLESRNCSGVGVGVFVLPSNCSGVRVGVFVLPRNCSGVGVGMCLCYLETALVWG